MTKWPTVQLRRVLRLGYGDSLPDADRTGGEVPVFGSNGRVGWHDSANTAGPVIVVGRKGSFGKIQFSSEPVFAIDTTFFVDGKSTVADLRWLFYLLQTLRLDELSEDVGVPGLSREKAYAVRVPQPPLSIQREIAYYLDAEAARIDTLIEKKHRLIDVLSERVRVLERMMTLDSAAQRVPLRWHMRVSSGEPFALETVGDDGSGISIVGGNGHLGFAGSETALVQHESIAVGRVGALCGNVHLVDPPAWITDNALWIRELVGFDRRFLAAALRASDLNSLSMQTAQPLITGETVKSLRLPKPGLDEQSRMANALSDFARRVERIRIGLTKQVELLREHRQALITAAVTGQLDPAKAAA